MHISINAYLINTGYQLIAIDAGADTFFGHVDHDASGYRYVPTEWQYEL